MNADDILDAVPEHPELLLALSLSAPNRSASTLRRDFAVEISEEHVTVRTPVPGGARDRSALLLCTKETISLAILLRMLWQKRGGAESEQGLYGDIFRYIDSCVEKKLYPGDGTGSLGFLRQQPSIGVYADLRSTLQIGDDLVNQAEERCSFAFETLERERLIIDPGFLVSPEWLVLLLGLIPMQWSVRSSQGERVYRRIRLNAPLWTLSIDRTKQRDDDRYNWDFEFRGINFVRRVLRTAAEHYIHMEDAARRTKRQPRLRPPDRIVLDHPQDNDEQ